MWSASFGCHTSFAEAIPSIGHFKMTLITENQTNVIKEFMTLISNLTLSYGKILQVTIFDSPRLMRVVKL